MNTGKELKFDTLSEAELEPVLAVLQGADPDKIAQRSGIAKTRLLHIRDDLLAQVEQERAAAAAGLRQEKIGRNDPCPCGSGKKYKKCCGSADAAKG